uniref:DUF7041 domain-containing protein n=1 Tax=Mesocestoides corti TaxID=53468 RepID=A0A5K3FVX9_MESCO
MSDPTAARSPMENVISVSFPPYNSNARVWFLQIEAQFRNLKVTSQSSKYLHVVPLLPTEVATEVIDLIETMPPEEPYDKLKSAVLARSISSNEACLRHRLSGIELDHRSPSQLLRHIRHLAGDNKVDDSVLRQSWAKCLPANTNAIISILSSDTPLKKLAEIADKIHECFFEVTRGAPIDIRNVENVLHHVFADRANLENDLTYVGTIGGMVTRHKPVNTHVATPRPSSHPIYF